MSCIVVGGGANKEMEKFLKGCSLMLFLKVRRNGLVCTACVGKLHTLHCGSSHVENVLGEGGGGGGGGHLPRCKQSKLYPGSPGSDSPIISCFFVQ